MITIELTTKDPLYQVRQQACLTLGKKPSNKVFSKEEEYHYWIDSMIANESILRAVHFKIIDDHCRNDIMSQLLRATKGHPQPECQSHRPDWINEPRKPSDQTYGMFYHEHTAESFMDMCEQRLCFHTMKDTRDKVVEVINEMNKKEEPFFRALAFCCVPECVRRCGCTHGKRGCGWFSTFIDNELTNDKNALEYMIDIKTRYSEYHH